MTSTRTRVIVFGVLVAVVLGLGVAYLTHGAHRRAAARSAQTGTRGEILRVLARPHVVFRITSLTSGYGHVGIVPLDRPRARPVVTSLTCDRISVTGAGGVCLSADRSFVTTYRTRLLGPDLTPTATVAVPGEPSRARASRDGRWAATTTFVSGHSYAAASFSTATLLYDMRTGRSLGNVESFRFLRHGRPYRSADINVWGVTFAPDGRRFYVSVKTRNVVRLAEGDLRAREIRMLDVPAECPSLSPDGTRIAYKRRTGGATWRLHVLDLRSGADTALAETRSVDDQVEWLDAHRVVYGLPRAGSAETDVWVVPADGSGAARLLIPRAWSPAAVFG